MLGKISSFSGPLSTVSKKTSVDVDAQAFITAASITDATQKSAINQLVIDFKSYGIWTKMKAIYPFVGATSTTHKWNLKDPRDLDAAFRLVFSGGWTHTSTGAKPNGINGYAETYLTSNTSLSLNSTHISYYSRTDATATEVEIGTTTGPNAFDTGSLIELRTSTTTYFRVNSLPGASYITYADGDSRAFYIANRTSSSVVNGWRNSLKVATGLVSSNGRSTRTFWIGAFNSGGSPYYSTKECAFATIGDGLTDTEATNFYAAVQAYQTTLSRQV